MASWWARALLAILAMVLALASGINAAANHWRMSRPDIALKWRPGDAVALTVREDQRHTDVSADVTAAGAASTATIARRALRSDPLTAAALRQVAMGEQRPERARSLVLLAHQVSRRELGSLVWLIQDSFADGTAQSVLRYFDEALLTNPIAPDILHPALSAGLVDPALRVGLVPLLRDNRPWMSGFLHYAATTGEGARYVAAIVISAGGLPRQDGYSGLNSQVLSSLAGEHDFGLARAYLRRVNGTGQDISVDPRFNAATISNDLGPFAWNLIEQDDKRARWDGAGKLRVTLESGQSGQVASRMLMLLPGGYRFVRSVAIADGSAAVGARWELRCLPDRAAPLILARDVAVRATGQTHISEFAVPDNCAGQQLALTTDSDNDQGEAELVISRLDMVKH